MKIIHAGPAGVVGVLPPTRRTILGSSGSRRLVSLPYQVIVNTVPNSPCLYNSIRMLFSQKPIESLGDTVYALPLSNTYKYGFVCGIYNKPNESYPEETIAKCAGLLYQSLWHEYVGYHWDTLYMSDTNFVDYMAKVVGGETVLAGQGSTYRYTNILNLWTKASAINPDFIMEAPLLPACTVSEMLLGNRY